MKLRVMVVEDDPVLCDTFAAAVDAQDDMFAVARAHDLEEGRRAFAQSAPDVLLVDLDLPDGSGTLLIAEARRLRPACETMVITMFGDERHVLAAIEAGATGYLLKDADGAQIAEQVRALHAGGSPISPTVARQLLRRFTGGARGRGGSAPGLGPGAAPEPDASDDGLLLSHREREVLNLSAKGYNYEEIGALIGVSHHTVTTYVKRIYRKLQVHSKTEAVYEARRMGLLRE